jgi:hypothetical protein
VLRLTFADDVPAESVIQHLLETFNDDGSLVDAVVERTQAEGTPDRTTGR